MADDEGYANDTEAGVLKESGFKAEKRGKKEPPIFRMLGDAKIPVSKQVGVLWKSRFDHAKKIRDKYEKSWDQAIRYLDHDQVADAQGDRIQIKKMETENLVFANTTTMLPAIYSKNPSITCSAVGEGEDKPFMTALSRLINVLFGQAYLNLKPKVRRAAMYALLTNYGWLKLDWIDREFSTEETYKELIKKAEELAKAKTEADVKRIEGELIALELQFDIVADSGPLVSVKAPKQILVDPACDDVSDVTTARWVMEEDYLPTAFIRAKYMIKDAHSEEYKYIYAPTHVASAADGNDDTARSTGIRLLDYTQNNEDDEKRFDEALYTKVWYVWDKVTRLLYMFNDKCWTYPIWVWQDPLKLSRFFPYFGLPFVPSTTGGYGKGEVTYYMDQQDAINDINAEFNKVRRWAFSKFIYDKNKITFGDVEKILNSTDKTAIGIDVPEGMAVKDIFSPILPPSAQIKDLFSKDDKYKIIDRISAVNDGIRGGQFKTNTTEDAVQTYNDAAKMRIGEKVDAVEDLLADLANSLAELCVSKFDQQRVAQILSDEEAKAWKQMTTAEFRKYATVTIAAGSTEKPTSASKQERAVKIGQVVGQFAQAVPAAALIVIKMMSKAFDEFIVSTEDFEKLAASMEQKGAGGEGGQGDPAAAEALGAALQLLPPEVKQAIQGMIDQGASPPEALMQVVKQKQGAAQGAPPQPSAQPAPEEVQNA